MTLQAFKSSYRLFYFIDFLGKFIYIGSYNKLRYTCKALIYAEGQWQVPTYKYKM